MTRFILIDDDDNQYPLSDNTFKILEDAIVMDSDFIERSSRPGADFPGIQREQSKSITFQYDINEPNDAAFRIVYNTYRKYFKSTAKIRDTILNIEAEFRLESHTISYDEGGYLRGARGQAVFRMLTPFWESVDYTTETETGTASDSMVLNVVGYMDTPPIITVTAESQITRLLLRIFETDEGIYINDLTFGQNAGDVYIIDCKEGTCEMNGVDRRGSIRSGTGFFNLQPGANTLLMEFTGGTASVEVKWKERSFA